MYPQPVEEISLGIYNSIKEELKEDYPDQDWIKPVVLLTINKYMLPKFLNDQELKLTVEEALQLLNYIQVDISVESLKRKGLIDTIENEKEQTVIFLTKEGKKIKKQLFAKKKRKPS